MKAFHALAIATLLLCACEKEKDQGPKYPPEPAEPAASPAAVAKQVFTENCVMCHGLSGRGDGTAAANLQPRPRDYSDPTWQANVTDELIRKTILEGGAAVGKSPSMMAFGNLPALKDPKVVDELVKLIRGFGNK
jgi:mono/diheme cytochrome c family protein